MGLCMRALEPEFYPICTAENNQSSAIAQLIRSQELGKPCVLICLTMGSQSPQLSLLTHVYKMDPLRLKKQHLMETSSSDGRQLGSRTQVVFSPLRQCRNLLQCHMERHNV